MPHDGRFFRPQDSRHGRRFQGASPRRNDTKAVIDIGSNSIKLRVVRRQGSVLRTLVDTTEVVRLGKGLQSGYLDETAVRQGIGVVRRLVRLAGEMGARPRLVATMALRIAKNAGDFVRRVRERTGLTVEILSGEEEARLAWLGAIYGLGAGLDRSIIGREPNLVSGEVVVFDTGGGSTEFIFGADGRIAQSVSVPIGAVRMTETFFSDDPVAPDAKERAREYVDASFSAVLPLRRAPSLTVIGLGGGVAAIASVKLGFETFNPEKINGTCVTREDVEAQIELYASRTLVERMKIPGLTPKRADIVLASACIVQSALAVLAAESFTVSINGLRHGLLLEMFRQNR